MARSVSLKTIKSMHLRQSFIRVNSKYNRVFDRFARGTLMDRIQNNMDRIVLTLFIVTLIGALRGGH